MNDNLTVLYVEPKKLPKQITIKNTLEEKQKLVGGLIEYTSLIDDNSVLLICNEEGKILGLPYNRDIGHDIIAGPFILVGNDQRLGEDISLTEEQIKKYTNVFNEKSIKDTENKILSILLKQKDSIGI